MTEEFLTRYFQTFDVARLSDVIYLPDFEKYFRKNERQGRFTFKVILENQVVAKSMEFECRTDRDRVFIEVLDKIYVDLHGQRQRTFGFR